MRGLVVAMALAVLAMGCRDTLVESRRAELEALCAEFCPRRVACVQDGYAEGDPAECERKCREDQRPLEDNECGEASMSALACLEGVACEDLAAAIAGVVGAGDAPCYAEVREQQDRCDFTPQY